MKSSPCSIAVFITGAVSIVQLACCEETANTKLYDHSELNVYINSKGEKFPVTSKDDWLLRRADILDGMQQAMGELPGFDDLPAFKLTVKSETKGAGFRRRTIEFTPEEGDKLAAFLYFPDPIPTDRKLPAMLALHPTGAEGKKIVAGEGPRANRQYALELARRGYVVICPDYPSFGDSKNYDFSNDRYASGTMKGIFNHMRCVDLLEQLEYVDKDRIGVIGHSLGGHNAMFLAAFDQRLKVTVSSCGWTPFHEYYGGKIAGWTSDRYMPRLRDQYDLDPDRVPFDFYEVVAAIAPRAFFSSSPVGDENFAVAGVKKAIPKAREIYSLLDAEAQLEVRYPDCDHDFPDETREESYRFIDAALNHKPTAQSLIGWKAGVAKTPITPKEKMWMSGYAGRDHPAEGTLHDLWAKVIVLQDVDQQRNVLISLDLIGIDRELSQSICKAIEKQHGIPRANIAIATSHTHTGPVVGRNLMSMYFFDDQQRKLVTKYTDQLEQNILKTVDDAIVDIEPVILHEGIGEAGFAVNRRNNPEKEVPVLRNTNKLKGPIDHELPVLAVKNQADELKAVVFGYACHATVLSFYQWSGDWPGFAQIEIEKRHPSAVAIFWAGCGADQNPLPRRTVELAHEYGNQIADGVDTVLKTGLKRVTGKLAASYKEINIPFDELPTEKQLKADTESSNRYIASRARHLLKQIETNGQLRKDYPYPIQLWRIGDQIRFVVLGGEVTVDYSVRLKHELQQLSELDRIWVAGYANDVMAYIPSRRVLLEGGYEGDTSMIYYGLPTKWDPRIEEQIITAVRRLAETTQTESRPK